jgi:carboxyl-terminal processing protease
LFAEVSSKIDERSLEPTSYDVRVRRALRNLGLALDNEAFIRGLRISSDSFRTDAFRESLGRLAGRMTVRNRSDAVAVMNSVMKESERVSGLTASVVAWEFALASLDTLDKFSGLDPADPDVRRGAEADGWQTAALDEEIVGIGVEVREHADGLLVVKPLKGSPAAEAGLRAGDVVTAIDGRKIAGLKMTESSDLMKGTAGTRIVLAVTREDGSERTFTILRRKVRIWTVNDVRMLNSTGTAYLSLSRFSAGSTAELDAALESLYSRGMKSLVLDLRGNPGGLLTTCVEIADRFLPVGTIVSTRGRLPADNMVEKATFARTWSMPLVVLIDGDSASASEIFAAAIQENRRGVVVGVKSYGKGSVQTHFPLNSIAGDLRITTALFYSPNGRRMAGEGVNPDVEVSDRDGVANGDRMLLEAERLAGSTELLSMARSAARVRPADPAKPRSAALGSIADPVGGRTAVH